MPALNDKAVWLFAGSGSIQMLLGLVLPTRRTITKEFAPNIKILNKTASMSVLIEADMFSAGILLTALAQGWQ